MPTLPSRTRSSRRASLITASLLALLAALSARSSHGAEDDSAEGLVDLRGSHRTRYERLAPQYRAGFGGSDTVLALQTSLVLETKGERFSFLGEILDARAALNDTDSFLAGVVNTLEPIQTHLTWRFAGDDNSDSSLRFGRMTIDLGKRRLLARSNFRHSVASFTGADWQWQSARGTRARAFYVLPMRTLPDTAAEQLDNDPELDRGARDTTLWGAYYLSAPRADRTQFELSFLTLDSARGAGEIPPLDIRTLSVRVFRPVPRRGLNYEVEAGLQRGESTALQSNTLRLLDHDAYYAHAEIGYAFDVAWTPNLLLQYDRASGDRDPSDARNERFNPLFGERRFDTGPTGIYGAFQRSNIATPGVRLTFNPAPRWRAMVAYRRFLLDAARDAWVGSGWRDATGQAGRSLGRQIEASFTWAAIPERLSIETGAALVDSGRFSEQTAGAAFRGSPRYFYAAVSTSF
jgi:hypothetical protein